MQFHPTAVTGIKGREGFLVTEAIRGEGATLLDADGERFVEELAPRDEVARAIWSKMAESGRPSVDLDMRAVDPALFPNVVSALREAGLDPATELVPVAPGGALRHGRDRRRPRRRDDGARALRGRRERLHGPARRQSPGLQLAHASASSSARAPRSPPSPSRAARRASRRRRPPSSRPAARPAPRCGATPAWCATPQGCSALADDPHPLARLIARHALLRAESRGAHTRSDCPRDRSGARSAPLGHARRRGRARLRALGLAGANTASSGERAAFLNANSTLAAF